ncbi:N6AMT2 [Symbiodinium sp. CCMP2456]|nr:N6AMT2 [Symbiodinium sp. CCMP2456]
MPKAAVHPTGSNFRRAAKLDVVSRVRMLNQMGLLKERPRWLEWCQRVPPMENHNLHLQARTIRNPYPQMVDFLLKKYPDLRFQDCYVDGNDWSAGNDAYRDDHPVMQFVAQQLKLMREEGLTKREAFKRTEDIFRERRESLEREQKVMMAMAIREGFKPMFSTGRAYLEVEKARIESGHLTRIISALRKQRASAEETRDSEAAQEAVTRRELKQAVEEAAQMARQDAAKKKEREEQIRQDEAKVQETLQQLQAAQESQEPKESQAPFPISEDQAPTQTETHPPEEFDQEQEDQKRRLDSRTATEMDLRTRTTPGAAGQQRTDQGVSQMLKSSKLDRSRMDESQEGEGSSSDSDDENSKR